MGKPIGSNGYPFTLKKKNQNQNKNPNKTKFT